MNNIELTELLIREDIVLITGPNKTGKSILLNQLSEELDIYNKRIYIDYRKVDRNNNELLKEIKEVTKQKNKKVKVFIDNLGEGLNEKESKDLIKELKELKDIKIIAATNNEIIVKEINKEGVIRLDIKDK